MTNRFLQHSGAKYPIIQAPMGWIARSQLASAVCAAGGLGIIETSSGETDTCKAEIEKMFELTDAPFGVNLPILFLKDDAMLTYICESGVKFVTTSAGSPSKFIGPLKEAGIVVYHAVPTVEAAIRCVEAGIDGLVVEGGEGGGFKNPEEVSTLVLLQAIRAAVDVPLVAAGGICDGRGMAAAFALGAEAVQMGTRFVSSAESPVHGNYKSAIVDAATTGTYVLNKKASPCIRALKTERTHKIYDDGLMPPDTFKNILDLYFGGDMEASVGLAGQTSGLIQEVKPVADIIETMTSPHAWVVWRRTKVSSA
jgi:enoyl-[acyl-carrier protein] reductase II